MLYLNSSCINIAAFIISHLTLTNVVFELATFLLKPAHALHLTLTNVVFEFWSTRYLNFLFKVYLTLTNVVFEFK